MAVIFDDLAAPLLTRLIGCWCAALADTVGGIAGCCCSATMGDVVWDSCEESMAWARVLRIFPSTVLPEQDNSLVPCVTTWAAEFEIGVLRCDPCNPQEDGQLPPCDCQAAKASLLLSDTAAIRRALACCLDDGQLFYVPGAITTVGPAGGCVGVTGTFVAAVPA